jgi:hypothetical protein
VRLWDFQRRIAFALVREVHEGFFFQAVLLNEFGSFQLFMGHPLLRLKLSSLFAVFVRGNGLSLNSFQFGSCVLSFENGIPPQFEPTNVNELKTQLIQAWLSNRMSTSEALIRLNHIAGRTFDDLSAYPIFPRVLRAFSCDSFLDALSQFRDLSLPLPVIADRDPGHQVLKQRMAMQNYHHCENISTAVSVSSYLVRVIPFLNFQIGFHEGFDVIDRIFRSVPIHFSIDHVTVSEFSPEVFLMPELFMNFNDVIVEGTQLDMQFPTWAPNAYSFTELHRYALESSFVRHGLNRWIDLVFGFKQSGQAAIDALNLYHPFGYEGAQFSKEQQSIRQTWIAGCGQLPARIFESPFPRFQGRKLSEELKFYVNPQGISEPIFLDCMSGSITGIVQYTDSDLFTAIDCQMSNKGCFIAITFAVSKVVVFRITSAGVLEKQAVLIRESPQVSVVNDRQLICATMCSTEIVIWSIVNGAVLNVLNEPNVTVLVFDDDLDCFFFAANDTIVQASLNGYVLRRLRLQQREITALGLIARGYAFDHRFVLVGTKDGCVLEVVTDFQSLQLIVENENKISEFPIVRFIGNRWTNVVDVLDTVGAQSVCI